MSGGLECEIKIPERNTSRSPPDEKGGDQVAYTVKGTSQQSVLRGVGIGEKEEADKDGQYPENREGINHGSMERGLKCGPDL